MTGNTSSVWTRDQIRSEVLQILEDKVRVLNPDFSGTIGDTTRIITDLGFESVTIVELCMSVGKHFRKKLPFQDLVFRDGQFQDFNLGDLVAFLETRLAA